MHNLPWGCTWQNLKDAFAASTQNIERADVIIDSSGRSRWASADHFWQPQYFLAVSAQTDALALRVWYWRCQRTGVARGGHLLQAVHAVIEQPAGPVGLHSCMFLCRRLITVCYPQGLWHSAILQSRGRSVGHADHEWRRDRRPHSHSAHRPLRLIRLPPHVTTPDQEACKIAWSGCRCTATCGDRPAHVRTQILKQSGAAHAWRS